MKLNEGSSSGVHHHIQPPATLELELGHSETGMRGRKAVSVSVRNACKRYSTSGPDVLTDFNMTVEKGTIYALLGSSGCGKTTVLSCIVGVRHLSSGQILLFGAKPGSKESGVPGKRVGYMPQELALYNDFSISEALSYFGRLYFMAPSEIETRRDYLVEFLELPSPTTRIGTLSGGQKRRVSLSLAMVHCPELLILDEPTVGVDALLRESIWNHLCGLVSRQGTTVILTTHYVEEAVRSHAVGVMRGGRLLAEDSPTTLFQHYQTTALEDIVLKLSRGDVAGSYTCPPALLDTSSHVETSDDGQWSSNTETALTKSDKNKTWATWLDPTTASEACGRLKAVIGKNLTVMMRNILLVLFMVGTPSVVIILVCMVFGDEPKPLKFGVVNYETNYSTCMVSSSLDLEDGCNIDNLSCRYLEKLSVDTIHLQEFPDEDSARDAVRQGQTWGFLSFPANFSDSVFVRMASGILADNETLIGANVFMEVDLSNKQIGLTLKRVILDAYQEFAKELLKRCEYPVQLAELPVKYRDPIYGTDSTDYAEFIAPSYLLGVLFFFPLCSSSVQIISDRKQGTFERARVAGVKTAEIMLAFLVTEGLVLIVETGLSFLIITLLFGITVKGSLCLGMSLAVLTGLGGVSMGVLIASFLTEEVEAVIFAIAAFYPNMLLSGMVYPIQGSPLIVQYIALFLPCTFGCEAMRSIVSRGWGLAHIKVWPGFLVIIGWITIYWILTACSHRLLLSKR